MTETLAASVATQGIDTPTSGRLTSVVAGAGPALTILHRSIGGESLHELRDQLAERFRVVAPSLPGYDDSDRPEWARSPRDLASIVAPALRQLHAEPSVLVGLGLGAWVAAEIATMAPERFAALVLVAPLGVQPSTGDIVDPFLVSTERYVELGFADAAAHDRHFTTCEVGSDSWIRRERNRETTTRIAWRPRMFDATLPYRLHGITTPTLVVWGDRDVIVPRSAAERYAAAIPSAELAIVPGRGHMLECEDAAELGERIAAFAARHAPTTANR